MHPIYQVSLPDGTVVINGPSNRALSCEVVDQEGRDSDSCTLVIDDRDGEVVIPPRGVTLTVSMGYLETGIFPMGAFIVDEVTVGGFPRAMVVRCRAADLRDQWKQGRTQDYHDMTLGDVIGKIAQRNGMVARVQGELSSFKYTYVGQTEESDLHFMTRLGAKHDATAKPTNGVLVFAKKGSMESASGLPIGSAIARLPGNVLYYDAMFKDRPRHSQAVGSYWDQPLSDRMDELGQGTQGPIFKLLPMFPDGKEEAKAAAQARSDKLARDEGELNIGIIGDPAVMAEAPLVVVGVRTGVDGTWRIKTATHRIDSNGYETSITAEYPGASSSGTSGVGAIGEGATTTPLLSDPPSGGHSDGVN